MSSQSTVRPRITERLAFKAFPPIGSACQVIRPDEVSLIFQRHVVFKPDLNHALRQGQIQVKKTFFFIPADVAAYCCLNTELSRMVKVLTFKDLYAL